MWGTGCDDAWSTGGATVVCQQLEYSTRSEVAHVTTSLLLCVVLVTNSLNGLSPFFVTVAVAVAF